jgi:hypothetical protein
LVNLDYVLIEHTRAPEQVTTILAVHDQQKYLAGQVVAARLAELWAAPDATPTARERSLASATAYASNSKNWRTPEKDSPARLLRPDKMSTHWEMRPISPGEVYAGFVWNGQRWEPYVGGEPVGMPLTLESSGPSDQGPPGPGEQVRMPTVVQAAGGFEGITADGVRPVAEEHADADLVVMAAELVPEITPSIIHQAGAVMTPDQVNDELLKLSRRIDRGQALMERLIELKSIAEEVHGAATTRTLLDFIAKREAETGRTPRTDLCSAHVYQETARSREQLRRLTVLLKLVESRRHNLSRMIEVVRSMGTNVRAQMQAEMQAGPT